MIPSDGVPKMLAFYKLIESFRRFLTRNITKSQIIRDYLSLIMSTKWIIN